MSHKLGTAQTDTHLSGTLAVLQPYPEATMPNDLYPTVLCVDDDEDSREMLSLLLKFWRIETKTVGTAAEALSLMQAERFNLYLLDTFLPDLDGFELCRRVRALDTQAPILFFSGAAYEADKQKGIDAGANAYVAKPDVEGVLGCIKQFVWPAPSALA